MDGPYEARRFHLQSVGSVRNTRKGVNAVFICGRRPGGAALLVARRNRGANNGASRGIRHPAGQSCADLLRQRRREESGSAKQNDQQALLIHFTWYRSRTLRMSIPEPKPVCKVSGYGGCQSIVLAHPRNPIFFTAKFPRLGNTPG